MKQWTEYLASRIQNLTIYSEFKFDAQPILQ